jgi:hypothetical protein
MCDVRTQLTLQQKKLQNAITNASVLHGFVPPNSGIWYKFEFDLKDVIRHALQRNDTRSNTGMQTQSTRSEPTPFGVATSTFAKTAESAGHARQ